MPGSEGEWERGSVLRERVRERIRERVDLNSLVCNTISINFSNNREYSGYFRFPVSILSLSQNRLSCVSLILRQYAPPTDARWLPFAIY